MLGTKIWAQEKQMGNVNTFNHMFISELAQSPWKIWTIRQREIPAWNLTLHLPFQLLQPKPKSSLGPDHLWGQLRLSLQAHNHPLTSTSLSHPPTPGFEEGNWVKEEAWMRKEWCSTASKLEDGIWRTAGKGVGNTWCSTPVTRRSGASPDCHRRQQVPELPYP